MKAFSDLARRLRRRGRTGAALFDALLALSAFAVVATFVVLFIHRQEQDELAEEAGRQVATLGHVAAHYARTHYADVPATFSPNARRLLPGLLESRGILPEDFPTTDAMRRDLRVWYRRVGTHPNHSSIQVLAGQSQFVGGGDTRIPHRALFRSQGRVRLGLVRTDPASCSGLGTTVSRCLIGPTVAESLMSAPFNAGWIEEGAIMAFYEITREEYCGDLVLREATAVCPNSADLSADLDMTDNVLRSDAGAGQLRVGSAGTPSRITVGNDMEAASLDIAISGTNPGGFVVERDIIVSGALTVSGGLAVYGNVEAENNLTVTSTFDIKGDLDVEGSADATTVFVRRNMDIRETGGENLNVDYLGANNCTANGSSCNE